MLKNLNPEVDLIQTKSDVKCHLNDNQLIMYCDDDKKLDQQYYSVNRDGARIVDVGNKWADFQIVNFGKNSQPLYILMTPDEELLAHPRGYYPSVKDYKAFLECGYNAFENQQIGSLE